MPKARKLKAVFVAVREVLKPVCELVKGSGVPGLEGLANLVLAILTQIKLSQDNDSSCQDLVNRVERLAAELKAVYESATADTVPNNLPNILKHSTEMQSRINTLKERLENIRAQAAKLEKASGKKRFLAAGPDAELLKAMAESVQHAIDDFKLRGHINIEQILQELLKKAENDAEEEQNRELDKLLIRLPGADGGYLSSVHSRHGGLLAGTRSNILEALDTWATEDAAVEGHCPFYVLTGGAGTGKSTIAFEFAQRAAQRGHLGASFFFVRDAASLNTPDLVFPTIARQLINNIPALKPPEATSVLEPYLRRHGNPDINIQAQELFVALLSKLPADHHPIVIVIDAVDECTVDTQNPIQRMLFLMMDGLTRIACSQALRIFVTSRPEIRIERALQSRTFGKLQRFSLHEIPISVVGGDIERYLQHAFDQLELSPLVRDTLAREYPDAIKDLTTSSMGLFIYAATIVEFLRSFVDEEILHGASHLFEPDLRGGKPALTRLAEVYIVVLETAFPETFRAVTGHNTTMKTVLGFIAVLRDHISPAVLAELAGIELQLVNLALRRLAPVLRFNSNCPNDLIRPLHASFAEFLVDPAQASRFQVDACMQHQFLAKRSLVLLMQRRLLSDFLDRLRRGETVQSSEKMFAAVRYACLYWPVHVVYMCAEPSDSVPALVASTVEYFCSSPNFVVWMEILAHLAQLHVAAEYLSTIRDVLKVYDSKLAEVLDDCYLLIMEFTPAILEDPHQLVVSALPQCRETSSLLQGWTSTAPALRTVFPRRNWSPWTEVEVGDPPDPSYIHDERDDHAVHVFPAPNGKWFAVYTRGQAGDVYLCDGKTARALQTLHCHDDEIYELDISPNSRLLVTASAGGEVHITDIRSGSRLYRLSDQSDICFVCFVTAFSGDQAILLAESTGHFRLWKFLGNPSEIQMLTDRVDTDYCPYEPLPYSLSPRVRTLDTSQVIIPWQEDVIVWVDVHRDVIKSLRLPAPSQVYLLGPYRALVCGYRSGSPVVETYSLFNGELDLLHSEKAPFDTGCMIVVATLNGDLAAICNRPDGNPCIWNPTTSISEVQPLERIGKHDSLSISADGRYIYALKEGSNSCRVVDLHNTRLHACNMASRNVDRHISVSADSSTVAIAEVPRRADELITVTAYRISDGLETFRLTPCQDSGSFRSITLDADGKLLLLCYDTQIQLWGHDSCIATLDFGFQGSLRAATMSEDVKYIIGIGYLKDSTPPVVITARWSTWTSDCLSVHIDQNLDIYIVQNDDHVNEWQDTAWVLEHRIWSAAPKEGVQLPSVPRIPNERFTLHRNGWVTGFDDGSGTVERLCWIPPSRRIDYNVRFQGHILPLFSDSGELSLFDLSAFEENAM